MRRGKKEGNSLIRHIIFSHKMISVAETLSSICANLQFREVSEHHGGSSRSECLDLSDTDSAHRNQK